jgi:hypothetical protein
MPKGKYSTNDNNISKEIEYGGRGGMTSSKGR